MTRKHFAEAYEDTLLQLEEILDNCDAELEYDTVSDILTIEFDNGSKLIINRQAASEQLWVAARSGGYHFDYDPDSDSWHNDRDGSELFVELSRLASEQAGQDISLLPG
jgi:CyaY protein